MNRAHPALELLIGTLILLVIRQTAAVFRTEAGPLQKDLIALEKMADQIDEALRESNDFKGSSERELSRLKNSLPGAALTSRELYEESISLQEEKRQLENLKEIMQVYLKVDLPSRKILLMRGDQAAQEFRIFYSTPEAFGNMEKAVPVHARIVSKERFASPERGKTEEVGGSLQWVPPQVGTSVRSNALGEYVMFTESGLILHGPPRKTDDHRSYPHLCLGLSLQTARKLYKNSFIGTRIVVEKMLK